MGAASQNQRDLSIAQNQPTTPADEPEVEGHYMNGFAAEQHAVMRQQQVAKMTEHVRRDGEAASDESGILNRIRRRFER